MLKLPRAARRDGGAWPAAFRRLCVETKLFAIFLSAVFPAAFRRLCVETKSLLASITASIQPPSGGCVLKRPPVIIGLADGNQPPSGGCVLKPPRCRQIRLPRRPAAFRRLCVETRSLRLHGYTDLPAAFRRLCVETPKQRSPIGGLSQPPSGGCVLKPLIFSLIASL